MRVPKWVPNRVPKVFFPLDFAGFFWLNVFNKNTGGLPRLRLNDTLKELCAETGARETGIERLLDYYIDGCGWSEDSAVEYVYELFENGTIDMIMAINGK